MDNTDRARPRHPIGVAAERTGLSADLIRAWERRYGVVEPERSEAGQRVYSDADVERLRMLRRATEGGRSIGQVAELAPDALAALVAEDEAARLEVRSGRSGAGSPAGDLEETVAALTEHALALDGARLESALRSTLIAEGLPRFLEGAAAPLLRGLGDGWHRGEVTAAQEHVATVAVRRVLDGIRSNAAPLHAPLAVVGTPPGDRHEVGALMTAAAAATAGWRVVYLGADLPVEDLAGAVERTGAAALCLSAVYAPDPAVLVDHVRTLRSRMRDSVLLIVGGPAAERSAEELDRLGVLRPQGVQALRTALLGRLRSGAA